MNKRDLFKKNLYILIILAALLLILFSYGCAIQNAQKEKEKNPYEGTATLIVKTIGKTDSYQIMFNNVTALQMLSQNFNVSISTHPALGAFINCINGVCGKGNYFWAFYINNKSSNVAASAYKVMNGDILEFRFTDKLE